MQNKKDELIKYILLYIIIHLPFVHRNTYLFTYQHDFNMAETATEEFKAVLIGSTGATGRYLLAELVKASEFTNIVALGRRKATLPDDVTDVNLEEAEASGRLQQEIIDFENLTKENVGKYFEDKDVFFSTFGTTRRIAGSAESFKHIDYGYNYELAKIAKSCNVRMLSLMSSQGANKNSWFLYLNSKGKLEHDIEELAFPLYSIFRPGILDRGGNARFAEKIASVFMTKIHVGTVARAMCSDALNHLNSQAEEEPKSFLFYNDQIKYMSETFADIRDIKKMQKEQGTE